MPDWSDDDIVMVSAIEHFSYCPRQCALIYVERVYDENVFTLRGSMAHERVDEPVETTEQGIIVERALPIWSERLGLQGRADVVEFHPDGSILPVEYKVGSKRRTGHAQLQLCAQAMCLEEMFDRAVTNGAVYSSSSHQRVMVEFTSEMRLKTAEIVEAIRRMIRSAEVSRPVDDGRCPNCSLVHVCVPAGVSEFADVRCEDFMFSPSDKEVIE